MRKRFPVNFNMATKRAGRPARHPVHNYFTYDETDNISECKVEGCVNP